GATEPNVSSNQTSSRGRSASGNPATRFNTSSGRLEATMCGKKAWMSGTGATPVWMTKPWVCAASSLAHDKLLNPPTHCGASASTAASLSGKLNGGRGMEGARECQTTG